MQQRKALRLRDEPAANTKQIRRSSVVGHCLYHYTSNDDYLHRLYLLFLWGLSHPPHLLDLLLLLEHRPLDLVDQMHPSYPADPSYPATHTDPLNPYCQYGQSHHEHREGLLCPVDLAHPLRLSVPLYQLVLLNRLQYLPLDPQDL